METYTPEGIEDIKNSLLEEEEILRDLTELEQQGRGQLLEVVFRFDGMVYSISSGARIDLIDFINESEKIYHMNIKQKFMEFLKKCIDKRKRVLQGFEK